MNSPREPVEPGAAAVPRGRDRWAEWSRLLAIGAYASRAKLARAVGVSRAAVTLGLRKLAG